jgi:hypothetical protein
VKNLQQPDVSLHDDQAVMMASKSRSSTLKAPSRTRVDF